MFTKEIKVGLAAICAIALLIYGLNFLKGINIFQNSNLYYVAFNDIRGLGESNPVYANGYRIGIVRTINYDYKKPGNVYVGIEVEPEMHITEGSRAELVSQMLGGVTMNIILAPSPKALQPGDTIYGGPQMGALDQAAMMMPQVQTMLPHIDSLFININQLLSNPAIAKTLSNAALLTDELRKTTDAINYLMANQVPAVATNLQNATGALQPAMENLTPITNNLKALTSQLNEADYLTTIKTVNSTLENLQSLSATLSGRVNTTLDNVDHTLSALNSPTSTVGLLLNDRTLYDNINSNLRSSDSLLIDLRQHPKRYVHFSLFGRKDK